MEEYADFTVKHFHEALRARHGYRLGYTVTRLALQAAGLVKAAPRRGKHRKKRVRRPLPGMVGHAPAGLHLADDCLEQRPVQAVPDQLAGEADEGGALGVAQPSIATGTAGRQGKVGLLNAVTASYMSAMTAFAAGERQWRP